MQSTSVANAALAAPVTAVQGGGVEVVERLAEEWRLLCDVAANDEPFYRPEWIAAHVRAFATQRNLLLITARSGGRLVAVLPMLEERLLFDGLPVTRLRSLSNIHSYRFDMLRSAGPEGDAAVGAVWNCLKTLSSWSLLQFEYVPEGGALEQLLHMAAAEGYPSASRELWRTPYVSTTGWDGAWDFWIKQTTANFRHTMRRIHRKLNDERPSVLQRVEKADSQSLRRFYELEASGWKGGEHTAVQSHVDTQRFYDEIALAAERFGYLALYFLEIDGSTVAAHLGLNYHGRYLVPKCAYDERYRELAPGHLIVNSILQDCAERGLREFDFLGPAMEWKDKWTSKARLHSALFIFRNDTYGSLLHTVHCHLRPTVVDALRRFHAAQRALRARRNT